MQSYSRMEHLQQAHSELATVSLPASLLAAGKTFEVCQKMRDQHFCSNTSGFLLLKSLTPWNSQINISKANYTLKRCLHSQYSWENSFVLAGFSLSNFNQSSHSSVSKRNSASKTELSCQQDCAVDDSYLQL